MYLTTVDHIPERIIIFCNLKCAVFSSYRNDVHANHIIIIIINSAV